MPFISFDSYSMLWGKLWVDITSHVLNIKKPETREVLIACPHERKKMEL